MKIEKINPICAKCKGAGLKGSAIFTAATVFILSCPVDIEKEKCPYLPPEQHTHQEPYTFPEAIATSYTVATTAGIIIHDSTFSVEDDPDRPGFKRYYIKVV